MEQYHVRSRMVVVLAFLFLFLSFLSLVGSWCSYDIAMSISPVPSIFASMVLWLPLHLLQGWNLLRAYKARQGTSELNKKGHARDSGDDGQSAGSPVRTVLT